MNYDQAVENFWKIEKGMNISQVIALLGEPQQKSKRRWLYSFTTLQGFPLPDPSTPSAGGFWGGDILFDQQGVVEHSLIEPGPKWRGIYIQAPEEVGFRRGVRVGEFDAFAAIPIRGFYMLNVVASSIKEYHKLVAIDKETGKVYSGEVFDLVRGPVEPPPEDTEPLTAEQVKGLASGGYFTHNLADFMQLPEASAEYDVHVEYRNLRSNVVTIRIVEDLNSQPP